MTFLAHSGFFGWTFYDSGRAVSFACYGFEVTITFLRRECHSSSNRNFCKFMAILQCSL